MPYDTSGKRDAADGLPVRTFWRDLPYVPAMLDNIVSLRLALYSAKMRYINGSLLLRLLQLGAGQGLLVSDLQR
jgi:2-polyprenyl-3-methyl-5-hydroxy-6-metoxy-1,4-benzoquinol methylase